MALEPGMLLKMKRIDIVVTGESLDHVIKMFKDAHVRGYTVIKEAGGMGSTGERNPEDYVLQEPNAVIMVACEENQAEKIIRILQPELKRFGGMCLVSDCQWVTGPPVSY